MLVVRHADSYAAERGYVLGVVLEEFLGLEWRSASGIAGEVEITLPDAGTGRLLIADRLFSQPEQSWLTDAALPTRPLPRWRVSHPALGERLVFPELPVIYGEPLKAGQYLAEQDREIRLGIDLFGAIFFQLTRYEELVLDARDEHGRFPVTAALAHQEGFLDRPLANEYVEILRGALTLLWPGLAPTRPQFQLRPSHDVDWPLHPRLSLPAAAKSIGGDVVRRRDPSLAAARVRAFRAQRTQTPERDPFNTFEFIMGASERAGLQSAFYFMTGRTDPRFDGVYSPEDPWIRDLIGRIAERGHEVGLHPSYRTFRDPALISDERDALARACEQAGVRQERFGGRQHFLRWENPITWRGWDQAGLAYDSSLGYSTAAGFRCGVCYEYPVFDLQARTRLGLRERPLIVMEAALLDTPSGRERDPLAVLETLRERCRMFGGQFTLLWHNSRLVSRRERALYLAALGGARA